MSRTESGQRMADAAHRIHRVTIELGRYTSTAALGCARPGDAVVVPHVDEDAGCVPQDGQVHDVQAVQVDRASHIEDAVGCHREEVLTVRAGDLPLVEWPNVLGAHVLH